MPYPSKSLIKLNIYTNVAIESDTNFFFAAVYTNAHKNPHFISRHPYIMRKDHHELYIIHNKQPLSISRLARKDLISTRLRKLCRY